jgi:hypothetical protein
MNLGATRTRLEMLTQALRRDWENTRVFWRDAKSEDFDRTYIQELLAAVEKTSGVIEKLDKLLTKVRHDCE